MVIKAFKKRNQKCLQSEIYQNDTQIYENLSTHKNEKNFCTSKAIRISKYDMYLYVTFYSYFISNPYYLP